MADSRTRRRALWSLIGVCLAIAVGYRLLPAGHTDVVYETESSFGRILVKQDARGVRSLYFDEGKARQGAVVIGHPSHLELAYTKVAVVGLAVPPKIERILFVGLGVGAMPMFTRVKAPDAHIDVVEIDPVVVDIAERLFGFRRDARMRVHVDDGRAFIEKAPPGSYDLIVLDAYSDAGIPYHLTTREFLWSVRARLTPDGVVVGNLWTSSRLYPSMLATFSEVFGELGLLRVGRQAQTIVVVSNARRRLDEAELVQASRALSESVDLGFDLIDLVEEGYVDPPRSTAPVLMDQDPG